MGAGKSKSDSAAKMRSQGKVEDLEAGGSAGGSSFVLPDAPAPIPPTTAYSSISPIADRRKLQPLPANALVGSPVSPPLPPGSTASFATGRSKGRKTLPSAQPDNAALLLSSNGASTALSAQTLAMAKFLGMNLQTDTQFMWIAQEALLAKLPEGWSEQRSDDGAVFFHHRGSGRSSWEHPKDAYFKFLYGMIDAPAVERNCGLIPSYRYSKFSNMKKGGKISNDGQNGKDRQMVDMLWAMEQDGCSSIGSSLTSESVSQSLRSGATSMTAASASTASRLTISSFCSSQLELDESRPIPREVQEIAKYLGIAAESLSTPVTPQEVRDMAEYLGINIVIEGFLLPLAKMSLQAPLPKNWEIYKDEDGSPFYFNCVTKATQYRHPADDYFLRKIAEERQRHLLCRAPVQEPWLQFSEAGGSKYWYNFATGERSNTEPYGV